MAQEDNENFESGENTILHEAIGALRSGDRARARDLITRMLKTDQNNATYWLWLSAAVDSQKERIYCLQSALRLEPDNEAAKRGLILFGAMPPDDAVAPFPVNHPRSWEDKLVVAKEPEQKPRGWANPVTRLFMILGIAALILGMFVGGYMLLPKTARPAFPSARTYARLPTSTMTQTPSNTPEVRTATPTFEGATPLAYFLEKTYTPTPVYIETEHPPLTKASYEAGLRYFFQGKYDTARVQFLEVLKSEPNAGDVYYYIGETYRMEQDYHKARDNYQKAIDRGLNFAPAFLGRARANIKLNPDADILPDLDEAIRLDPLFAEAFIERGKYQINKDTSAAINDLQTAIELTPNSALAYLYLSQAQMENEDPEGAIDSAVRANQLDFTMVPVYLAMGQAYVAIGDNEHAIDALRTYTNYVTDETGPFQALGTAYNATGQYDAAVDALGRAIQANKKNAEAYFQRGWAYLNLKKPSLAATDFKMAVTYDPKDFDSQLGWARALYDQGKPGDAYVQAETNAVPLAKSDYTKAQVYYWESIFLHDMPDELGERTSWYHLLSLPADVMPAEWRLQAMEALGITPTPTKTPRMTPTGTPTRIPSYTPTK